MEEFLSNGIVYCIAYVISIILGMVLYWGFETEYGTVKRDFKVNIIIVILIFIVSIISYVSIILLTLSIIATYLMTICDSNNEKYLKFKERFLKKTTINLTELFNKIKRHKEIKRQ